MIPTIFGKSFCCTPLFGKSEHGKVYPERKKRWDSVFQLCPKQDCVLLFGPFHLLICLELPVTGELKQGHSELLYVRFCTKQRDGNVWSVWEK